MQPFSTKDFNEAALLLAFRIPLITVLRDRGVCHFQFKSSDQAASLIEAFLRGDLVGNIRDFSDSQRRIKDLIHRSDGYGNSPLASK